MVDKHTPTGFRLAGFLKLLNVGVVWRNGEPKGWPFWVVATTFDGPLFLTNLWSSRVCLFVCLESRFFFVQRETKPQKFNKYTKNGHIGLPRVMFKKLMPLLQKPDDCFILANCCSRFDKRMVSSKSRMGGQPSSHPVLWLHLLSMGMTKPRDGSKLKPPLVSLQLGFKLCRKCVFLFSHFMAMHTAIQRNQLSILTMIIFWRQSSKSHPNMEIFRFWLVGTFRMNHLPIDPSRLPKIMQVGVILCILTMNGETRKDQ